MTHGGVDVPRDQHRHVARRGDQLHQDLVLALTSTHEDAADLVPGLVHGRDDLPRLQGDELHRAVIVQREPVQALVAAQAHDRPSHGGVGDRTPVPKQVAVEEEVLAEVAHAGRIPHLLEVEQVLVQKVVDVARRTLRHRNGLVVGRVCLQDVFEKFSSGRLSTFRHPVVRDDAVPVRSPYARYEHRIFGHDEMARRRTGDRGETGECLRLVVGRGRGVELVGGKVDFGADGADPACIGIDHA